MVISRTYTGLNLRMLIFVLIFNTVICLINCYLLWQIIRWKKQLTHLADTLENLEKQAPFFLNLMVLNLRQAEYQSLLFRQQYENLQQKSQKILVLLKFLKWFLQRYRTWKMIENRQVANHGG